MSAANRNGPSSEASSIPTRLQRRGQRLLSQQCWLWGQDVKRAEGNLLIEFGFQRIRPPEGISGSTQYTLSLPDGLRVRLWGFGMYFGAEHGVYINRYQFVARAAQFDDGWQGAGFMNALPRAGTCHLLVQASAWIAAYEAWVLAKVGRSCRQRALQGWKETVCKASEIPAAWRQLSCDLHAGMYCRRTSDRNDPLVQRRSTHMPYPKIGWPVATNLQRGLGFTDTRPLATPIHVASAKYRMHS